MLRVPFLLPLWHLQEKHFHTGTLTAKQDTNTFPLVANHENQQARCAGKRQKTWKTRTLTCHLYTLSQSTPSLSDWNAMPQGPAALLIKAWAVKTQIWLSVSCFPALTIKNNLCLLVWFFFQIPSFMPSSPLSSGNPGWERTTMSFGDTMGLAGRSMNWNLPDHPADDWCWPCRNQGSRATTGHQPERLPSESWA